MINLQKWRAYRRFYWPDYTSNSGLRIDNVRPNARMPVLSLNILTFNNLIAKKHFNGTHLRMYTQLHIDKIL